MILSDRKVSASIPFVEESSVYNYSKHTISSYEPCLTLNTNMKMVVLAHGCPDGRPRPDACAWTSGRLCLHSISSARLHSVLAPACLRLTLAFSRSHAGPASPDHARGPLESPSTSHVAAVCGCGRCAHCIMCNIRFTFETSIWNICIIRLKDR